MVRPGRLGRKHLEARPLPVALVDLVVPQGQSSVRECLGGHPVLVFPQAPVDQVDLK